MIYRFDDQGYVTSLHRECFSLTQTNYEYAITEFINQEMRLLYCRYRQNMGHTEDRT